MRILQILASRKVVLSLITAIIDVVILFGMDIPSDTAEKMATFVTAIAGVLVMAFSVEDHGKALHMPTAVDHKGRYDAGFAQRLAQAPKPKFGKPSTNPEPDADPFA